MNPRSDHDEAVAASSFEWDRVLSRPSNLALTFFLTATVVLGVAAGVAWALIATSRFAGASDRLVFPSVFVVSTAFMAMGSWQLNSACRWVRIERQALFRKCLLKSLFYGTAFVATQTYGLWCLLAQREIASLVGVRGGAFAFVVMHGVHFVVALLFVVLVLLRAFANRYDHEYSWGVICCAWFWHALGILWIVILGALLLASSLLHNEPQDWTGIENHRSLRHRTTELRHSPRAIHEFAGGGSTTRRPAGQGRSAPLQSTLRRGSP